MRSARLPDKDTGEVGERSVHGVHPNPTSPAAFSSGETGDSPGRFVAVVDVCCITVQYRTGPHILDLGQDRRGHYRAIT